MSKPLSGPGPACGLSRFSHVQLFAMLWTVTHRDPLSMGILQARILEWVAIPPPGDLPDPEIKPMSPALQADSLTLRQWGGPSLLRDMWLNL